MPFALFTFSSVAREAHFSFFRFQSLRASRRVHHSRPPPRVNHFRSRGKPTLGLSTHQTRSVAKLLVHLCVAPSTLSGAFLFDNHRYSGIVDWFRFLPNKNLIPFDPLFPGLLVQLLNFSPGTACTAKAPHRQHCSHVEAAKPSKLCICCNSVALSSCALSFIRLHCTLSTAPCPPPDLSPPFC